MGKYYKTKTKEYPDGSRVLTVYKSFIPVEISNTNFIDEFQHEHEKSEKDIEIEKQLEKTRNLWKVKTKIKDYCLSNDFTFFWTLTFASSENHDRYDDDLAFYCMGKWIEKMRKKYGRFKYIFIPERHKDGAIHFHGVTEGFCGDISYSGKKHKGKKVYNCMDWKYGFSTLSRIISKRKCATYISKYVTKELTDSAVEKGKKKYWCSRGLRKPAVTYSQVDLSFGREPDYENETCYIYKFDI